VRRAICALALCAPVLAAAPVGPAHAAPASTTQQAGGAAASRPTFDAPRLSPARATAAFLASPKVRSWLDRYPPNPRTSADFDRVARRWSVHVWSGRAGEVARGTVEDLTGRVLEAWTGPQVAWTMARGYHAAFAGDAYSNWWVWGISCVLFFIGLVDPKRLLSLRTLDVLALLSFTVSLVYFDRGEIFTSVPLAYPPLLYLLGRAVWIGLSGRPRPSRVTIFWPAAVLLAASIFLLGFRVGVNAQGRGVVIDVGYAGVVGADRILHGEAPYGHMPISDDRPVCGSPKTSNRPHLQTDGRCENANPYGDTYGPFSYLAYVPAVAAFGWDGRWDSLPPAHAVSIAFDILVAVGLGLVGLRFGGRRLAALLVFAWEAYPFTAYAMNSDTNDAIMPALLVWGFLLLSSPAARGAGVALASWTKFAALAAAPLWLTYPRFAWRPVLRAVAAFLVATLAVFTVLLLEPSLVDAIRTFWHRTIRFQATRGSPFSLWDWGQYHARGVPDLHILQRVLEVAVAAFAIAVAFFPRRERRPWELAALTAALLLATELVLTHWFYLYLPWMLPFVLLALFLPRGDAEPV
jgi:hypothetical protein